MVRGKLIGSVVQGISTLSPSRLQFSKIRCRRSASTRRRTLRPQSQQSRVRDRHSKCKRNPTKQLTKVTSSSRNGTHQVATRGQCPGLVSPLRSSQSPTRSVPPRLANRPAQATDGNFYGTTYRRGRTFTARSSKSPPQGTLITLHSFGADGADSRQRTPFIWCRSVLPSGASRLLNLCRACDSSCDPKGLERHFGILARKVEQTGPGTR